LPNLPTSLFHAKAAIFSTAGAAHAASESSRWFGNNNFQSQSFDSAQACSELAESDGEQTCLEHSRKSRTILTSLFSFVKELLSTETQVTLF
jgi:hypothetical protein